MEADLLIGALLVVGVLLGVFRGALRQLIIVGAWLVIFIVSIYLRPAVGDFIVGNVPQFSREYIDMLAFLSTFLILFLIVVVAVELRGATVHLSKRAWVDEILGGLLGLGWMVLAVATMAIALDSFYLLGVGAGADEISSSARSIRHSSARPSWPRCMTRSSPGLIAILGILLPGEIRNLYA